MHSNPSETEEVKTELLPGDAIEKQLQDVVKDALPDLSTELKEKIVAHLLSPQVGVSSPKDFQDIAKDDLKPYLGSVQIRKLLRAFAYYGQGPSTAPAACTVKRQPPQLKGDGHVDSEKFTFEVFWNTLKQRDIESLQKTEEENKEAEAVTMKRMRLSICKKVVEEYKIFKSQHPRAKKHPGERVYENIANQLVTRFPKTLRDYLNGVVVGDGRATIHKQVKICIENLLRSSALTAPKVSAKVSKSRAGVLPSQYSPAVEDLEKEQRKVVKEELKVIFSETQSTTWQVQEISRKMHQTYKLQRHEIQKVREVLSNAEPEDVDLIETPLLKHLKEDWPFLFEPRFLTSHYQQFTGLLTALPQDKFVQNDLENVLLYLTNCGGNATIKNLIVWKKLQASSQKNKASMKFLAAVMMLSNYFEEDYKVYIKATQKTTEQQEVNLRVDDLPPWPCLIVLDEKLFEAEKFYLCLGKFTLVETLDFIEAMRVFFEVAFVLDAEYPPFVQYTMEYLERLVFGVGLNKTRVIQGASKKTVTVISQVVAKLVSKIRKFKEDMSDAEAGI